MQNHGSQEQGTGISEKRDKCAEEIGGLAGGASGAPGPLLASSRQSVTPPGACPALRCSPPKQLLERNFLQRAFDQGSLDAPAKPLT